jgi:hypothetical protein
MIIAIVNKSSMCSNSEVETMVAAIQIQLNRDVLPAFNLKSATIQFFADELQIPAEAWTIYIIDNDAQVEGALGFHQEEADDKIDGYIMCEPILSNGGAVLAFDTANPGQYTVSATLSHEVIETLGDCYTNCWYDRGDGTLISAELCDCVEEVGYGINVNGVEVSVSDFVYPSFFNPYATKALNGPFNYLNTLEEPFTMLAGGYWIQRTSDLNSEQQVFGEKMPAWRRECKQKAFSRASRRNRVK